MVEFYIHFFIQLSKRIYLVINLSPLKTSSPSCSMLQAGGTRVGCVGMRECEGVREEVVIEMLQHLECGNAILNPNPCDPLQNLVKKRLLRICYESVSERGRKREREEKERERDA